jgi:hypothetical protein
MSPFLMAGCSTSREPMSVFLATEYPAASSAWAYISATIWFSANCTAPTVSEPLPPPPPAAD